MCKSIDMTVFRMKDIWSTFPESLTLQTRQNGSSAVLPH